MAAPTQAEQELKELSAKLFKLEETAMNSEPALKSLVSYMADDFLIRRGKGAELDRAGYEKAPPQPGDRPVKEQMVTITRSGDVGVVTCRLPFQGENWLNTQVFERNGGQWKCRLWQVRPIAQPQFAPGDPPAAPPR